MHRRVVAIKSQEYIKSRAEGRLSSEALLHLDEKRTSLQPKLFYEVANSNVEANAVSGDGYSSAGEPVNIRRPSNDGGIRGST